MKKQPYNSFARTILKRLSACLLLCQPASVAFAYPYDDSLDDLSPIFSATGFESRTEGETYTLNVKATGAEDSAIESFDIAITDIDEAPSEPVLDNNSIDENTTAVGTVSSIDPEGATIEYSITGGADEALFQIDSNTGELSFISAPDFETPLDTDANNKYRVQVTASDGVNSDALVFIILPNDVNEAPTALLLDDVATSETSISETAADGSVITELSTIDQDTGDTHAYELTNDADGRFAIVNGNQLVVANTALINYESEILWSVSVLIRDSGDLDATFDIDINILDEEETYPDIELDLADGGVPSILDLDDYFSGNNLIYEVSSSSTDLVVTLNDDNTINLDITTSPIGDSSYMVTATATDINGLTLQELFTVNYSLSRIYVDTNATGNGNGRSWNDAFTELRTAMSYDSTGDEIWVAAGVYTPSASSSSYSFEPLDDQNIYGGFAGGENSVDEADPATNVTVLSGNITSTDTTDANGVTLSWEDISAGSNSKNGILYASGKSGIVIDGFTICGGENDNSGAGGALALFDSSLTLRNCIFRGNMAEFGGAIYLSSSTAAQTLVMEDCEILQNRATTGGAGLHVSGDVTITMDRCQLSGNSADVYFGGASFQVTTTGNTLNELLVTGNEAPAGAGLAFAQGGRFTVTNATVAANLGHGIYVSGSTTAFNNCISWGNSIAPSISGNNPSWEHCLVENFGGSAEWTGSFFSDLGGNIDIDPEFIDSPDSSAAPTIAGDFRIDHSSPAADAGDNSLTTSSIDLDGNDRVFATTIDMGAYEADSYAAPTFNLIASVTADENLGSVSTTLVAYDFDANDVGQSLVGYTVSNDNIELFDVEPAIDTSGTLTFTTAPDAYGSTIVSVTATDDGPSDNQSETQTFTITINPVYSVASFSIDQTLILKSRTVQFTNTSTDSSEWEWDFDNDGIYDSTEENPSHTYNTAGTYTVKLTARNTTDEDSVSEIDLVRVVGYGIVNPDFSSTTVEEGSGNVNSLGNGWYAKNGDDGVEETPDWSAGLTTGTPGVFTQIKNSGSATRFGQFFANNLSGSNWALSFDLDGTGSFDQVRIWGGTLADNPSGTPLRGDDLSPASGLVDSNGWTSVLYQGTVSATGTVTLNIDQNLSLFDVLTIQFRSSSGDVGTTYDNFAFVPQTAPVASDDSYATTPSKTVSGLVFDNDTVSAYNDLLAVIAVAGEATNIDTQITLPSGALLTLGSDGAFTYNPNGAFDDLESGATTEDSFTYTIEDSVGSSTATVTITLTASNALTTFRTTYGLASDGSDDESDWSQNGVLNIYYYLFGLGDPNANEIDRNLMPTLTTSGDNVKFSYRSPASSDPIHSQAITSIDLETWIPLDELTGDEAAVGVSATEEADGYLRYTITTPTNGSARFFSVQPVAPTDESP